MAKVIAFEKSGEIRLATLIDDHKNVCRKNFTDVVPCPKELLACVPKKIAEFCKETAPHYLYLNSEGKWESTTEPENNNTVVSSLAPPTRDEVVAQLEKHFSEHNKDMVTPEDISKLADTISNAFDELRDKPYGGFAKYCPEKPNLTVRMYHDEWTLFDRERYPGDYSPLTIIPIKCSAIDFSMTVVTNTKWISLAYVSKKCVF